MLQTVDWRKIGNSSFYSTLFLETNDGAQRQVERYDGKSVVDGAAAGEQRGWC